MFCKNNDTQIKIIKNNKVKNHLVCDKISQIIKIIICFTTTICHLFFTENTWQIYYEEYVWSELHIYVGGNPQNFFLDNVNFKNKSFYIHCNYYVTVLVRAHCHSLCSLLTKGNCWVIQVTLGK